ncbi:MAG: DUF2500 domain-containing protein [Tissierellia bacterium]|nr:hypothetical protein [Bacillota bacterium]NLL22818.1 DUF2500 domain-containing protein [Tissierellia bacterium]
MNEALLSKITSAFWVLSAAVLIFLCILVISVIRRNILYRRSPVKVVHARLCSLVEPRKNSLPYRATFTVEEGQTLVLFIDRNSIAALKEGMEGRLAYRANTFLSFDRE